MDSGLQEKLLRRDTHIPSVVNPFENAAPWTKYEILKVCLLGPTLFPLRLVIGLTALFFTWLIAFIATLGIRPENIKGTICYTKPLPFWRQFLVNRYKVLHRTFLWALGYWHIKVIDKRKSGFKKSNIIVVSSHRTFTDPNFIQYVCPIPMPNSVGKKELLNMPLLGRIFKSDQGIFVDRKDPDSRHSCKDAIASRADPNSPFPPLAIYPEGTTTNGKALIQFKIGAFAAGQPVQPVLLEYPHRYFDVSWTGNNSNLAVALFRQMTQFANYVQITFLEPYIPSQAESADAALYANNVRLMMARELNVPTTEHSYDDIFLAVAATKANASQDFEVTRVRQMFDIDLEGLKDLLKQFRRFDTDKSGYISHDEFAQALRSNDGGPFSDEPAIDRLFAFFDTDGTDRISYREFVQGVAIFSGKCSDESRAKLAFLVFDNEGKGRVPVSRIQDALDNPLQHGGNAGSESLGARICRSAGGSDVELDFPSFCKLIEQHPDLVQTAMALAKTRLLGNGK